MLVEDCLRRRRKGVPQDSPLSLQHYCILFHELVRRGHRNRRYAGGFSIYVQSERAASRVGDRILCFLVDWLRLPFRCEKSGIRRLLNIQILGHGFVSIYRKGVKGQFRLSAAPKSWQRLKKKLKMLTRTMMPMSLDERKIENNVVVRD